MLLDLHYSEGYELVILRTFSAVCALLYMRTEGWCEENAEEPFREWFVFQPLNMYVHSSVFCEGCEHVFWVICCCVYTDADCSVYSSKSTSKPDLRDHVESQTMWHTVVCVIYLRSYQKVFLKSLLSFFFVFQLSELLYCMVHLGCKLE